MPVGSNSAYAQVQYTVSYGRTRNQQATYVLSGVITVQETSGQTRVIQEPVITVTTGIGKVLTAPGSMVTCPILTVPAGGMVTCNFNLSYTGAGSQPLPGTLAASVSTAVAGGPFATAPAVPYDFSTADAVTVGETATVTNFFEQGASVLQVRRKRQQQHSSSDSGRTGAV